MEAIRVGPPNQKLPMMKMTIADVDPQLVLVPHNECRRTNCRHTITSINFMVPRTVPPDGGTLRTLDCHSDCHKWRYVIGRADHAT